MIHSVTSSLIPCSTFVFTGVVSTQLRTPVKALDETESGNGDGSEEKPGLFLFLYGSSGVPFEHHCIEWDLPLQGHWDKQEMEAELTVPTAGQFSLLSYLTEIILWLRKTKQSKGAQKE